MKLSRKLCSSFIGLGLVLGISSQAIAAKMPANHNKQLPKIDQPLGLKLGVTLGGIGLIGLELWWFIFSKTKAKKAEFNSGFQEVTIKVNESQR